MKQRILGINKFIIKRERIQQTAFRPRDRRRRRGLIQRIRGGVRGRNKVYDDDSTTTISVELTIGGGKLKAWATPTKVNDTAKALFPIESRSSYPADKVMALFEAICKPQKKQI